MQNLNFHVPLPSEMYHQLRKLAAKQKIPATKLVRSAIEKMLKEEKRRHVYDSIRTYAERHAGTDVDLDIEIEAASSDLLSGEE